MWIKMPVSTSFTILFLLTGCSNLASATAHITPGVSIQPSATTINTATPVPTPTPMQLAQFSAGIEGVGAHGAMIRFDYSGNPQDLENLAIFANISQEGRILDEHIPLETIDGMLYAEMIEAKYHLGLINVELNATDSTQVVKQEFELNFENWFPWMGYYFGNSEIHPLLINFPNPIHQRAYDLTPNTLPPDDKYTFGKDHPFYSPCNGYVKYNVGEKNVDYSSHNFYLYCSETGFLMRIAHIESPQIVDDYVKIGQQIGVLFKDPMRYVGHTDMWVPYDEEFVNDNFRLKDGTFFPDSMCGMPEQCDRHWVDFFNPEMQLGGQALEYGFWLADTLPEGFKQLIENGVFKADYETERDLPHCIYDPSLGHYDPNLGYCVGGN